jgi:hypothetical protein
VTAGLPPALSSGAAPGAGRGGLVQLVVSGYRGGGFMAEATDRVLRQTCPLFSAREQRPDGARDTLTWLARPLRRSYAVQAMKGRPLSEASHA